MKHCTRTRKDTFIINWNWVEQIMGALHARILFCDHIHRMHSWNESNHQCPFLNNTAQLITPSSSLSAVTTTPMAIVRTGRLMGTWSNVQQHSWGVESLSQTILVNLFFYLVALCMHSVMQSTMSHSPFTGSHNVSAACACSHIHSSLSKPWTIKLWRVQNQINKYLLQRARGHKPWSQKK